MNAPRELAGWRRLGNRELEHDLDPDDDRDQQRSPPVATTCVQSRDGDSERDGADDFGLPDDREKGRCEIEPGQMRRLDDVQDRAIDARERAERDQRREPNERGQRCGAARQRVDVLTVRVRRLMM